IRREKPGPAIPPGGIRTLRTWDSGHQAEPIRDVPCAARRGFGAEAEGTAAILPAWESCGKRSHSWSKITSDSQPTAIARAWDFALPLSGRLILPLLR